MGYRSALQSVRPEADEAAGARIMTSDDLELVGRLMVAMRRQAGRETVEHSQRVAGVSALLAERLGMEMDEIWLIWAASHLHDVGKLEIDPAILEAPRQLTRAERSAVERHTLAGSRMLTWRSSSPLFRMAATVAETHHERFDGSGYPHGLCGHDIPLPGRLVAVADVFDALLSDRSYRPALELRDAVDVLLAERGSQFDPEIVDALFVDLAEVLLTRSAVGKPPHAYAAPKSPAAALAGAGA
jgi:putative two-component system response regulator